MNLKDIWSINYTHYKHIFTYNNGPPPWQTNANMHKLQQILDQAHRSVAAQAELW